MRKISLVVLFILGGNIIAYDKSVQVLFTANRMGEIEPCHCTTNQIGGLTRLANYVEKTKKEFKGETFFLDAGDTFFSLPKFPDPLKERELSKATLIAKVYRLLQLDFILFGERDFALGLPTLTGLLHSAGAHYPPPDVGIWSETIEKGKSKLGLIAILKAKEPIEKVVSSLKEKGADHIIVVSHQGFDEDKKLAEKQENILIVGGHSLAGGEKPTVVGKSIIVESKEEGKNIGRVIFNSPDVTAAKYEFVDLGREYDGKNRVAKLVGDYIDKEKEKTIASEKNAMNLSAKKAFVANPFVCKQCHEKQFEFWKNTKHASAYLVLYAKNQHFDPDCVSCHVLGFKSAEGFNKISEPLHLSENKQYKSPFVETLMKTVFKEGRTPLDSRADPSRHQTLHARYWEELDKMNKEKKVQKNFLGVQCEHCHGNRGLHVSSGARGEKTSAPTTCLACHRAPNAPDFKQSMIPLASCPK